MFSRLIFRKKTGFTILEAFLDIQPMIDSKLMLRQIALMKAVLW